VEGVEVHLLQNLHQLMMWQDNYMAQYTKKQWLTDEYYFRKKWFTTYGDTASTHCDNLTLGGYSNWRIPSETEFNALNDYSFTHMAEGSYWTSTVSWFYENQQRITAKGTSTVMGEASLKDWEHYVRCVR